MPAHPPDRQRRHWIVRLNYRNRSIFFASLVLVLGNHMLDNGFPPWAWLALALQCLAYPSVLYWRCGYSANPLQTEINHMKLDAVAFGAWSALLAFPLWITFILFISATVNLTVVKGAKGLILALLAFPAGALPLFASTGFLYSPDTSPVTTAMSIVCITAYLQVLAGGAYVRALRLHEAREQLRASESALQKANLELTSQLNEIGSLQTLLREQANRDALTGLYNRRYLDSTIEREIARCKREGHPLSVMLIDIDHFKRINDNYGHQAGDEVLRSLAKLLQTRTMDIACRYGGEEFLLLLPDMPIAVAKERAEQFRSAFEETTIGFGSFSITATFSVGLAAYPGHGTSAEALIRAADHALYQAKSAGRNRVAIAEPDQTV